MTTTLGAALLLASVAAPSRSQPPTLESFDGRFELSGGQHSLEEGIDHVVDQLNLFIREIARGEIHRRITAEHRVQLDVENDTTLSVTMDDWGPVRLRLDGRSRRVPGPNGHDIRVAARFDDGRIRWHQVHSRGSRDNVLGLSGDGRRLSMRVRIGADQLPDDIRYGLVFRRVH